MVTLEFGEHSISVVLLKCEYILTGLGVKKATKPINTLNFIDLSMCSLQLTYFEVYILYRKNDGSACGKKVRL